MTTGLLDLESSAARTTAPPRLRRLDIALSPLKLGKFGGRTSPNRLGPPSSIATYFEDTLETEPTAYLPSRLLMMQATEKARNAPDQRLATNGLATTHDDARESFASGGSKLVIAQPTGV